MLTEEMKRVVAEQKLGFVASICADGTPNLSPKGTFLVRDDAQLMFAEIRSPNTRRNIAANPNVEINFVDVFARKGFRFKGKARFIDKGTQEYEDLLPAFIDGWGEEFAAIFNGIVTVAVESAAPLSTPAYDIGAEETALRKQWLTYFTGLQPS